MRALPPSRLGFRVDATVELAGWTPVRIGPAFPLELAPDCPADGSNLVVICTFVGHDVQLRVGVCQSCGHVAYIDRPTGDWLNHYYRDTWDAADRQALAAEVERRTRKLASLHWGPEREAVTLAKGLALDRSRPVCEIGCGYGSSLKQLEHAGFSRLVGLEASRHRSEVTRRAVHASVFNAPFESTETQTALQKLAPFGLIYSIHALEHTTQPRTVIAAAAALQDAGDHLIVSVPNLQGEPSMSVLFFLPHLHTFTRESLVRLAGRFGYQLIDDTLTTERSLNLAFRKHAGTSSATETVETSTIDRTLEKLARGLALSEGGRGRRRLWWLKRTDRAGQVWWSGIEALDAWRWRRIVRRHSDDRLRAIEVTQLARRHTDIRDSPLEIQFDGDVQLFCK